MTARVYVNLSEGNRDTDDTQIWGIRSVQTKPQDEHPFTGYAVGAPYVTPS